MSETLFLRLLSVEDKAEALAEAIATTREGSALNSVVYTINPDSLEQIPGSPFAYWVSENIRRLFKELPPFESGKRTVKQGLATADDFRFVRVWWEVSPIKIVAGTTNTTPEKFRQQTFDGKRWVPFAKGGEYSPYHTDLYTVVNWEWDGEELKSFAGSAIRNPDFYFRSGITWPLRGIRLSAQAVPSGAMFSVAGKLATSSQVQDLPVLLGLINSRPFDFLVGLFAGKVGGVQYEVGLISKIPIPKNLDVRQRQDKTESAYRIAASWARFDEITHLFILPAILQIEGTTLDTRTDSWQKHIEETENQLAEYRRDIDDVAFRLYGIEEKDRQAIEATLDSFQPLADAEEVEAESAKAIEAVQMTTDQRQMTADLLSYFFGCAFGRWDVRYATGERPAPELADAFAPLPVSAPGALIGPHGLPLRKSPPDYPLRVEWDGIFVDEPEHDDDIIRRVRDLFELLWQKRAEEIEREACALLGVKELRDYFRKPSVGSFWTDHVKRYSKSRRKAPIYWLLRSSKGSYSIWLYYHRLDKDTLFKALLNYVEPKIRLEENNLAHLRGQREKVGAAGREAKLVEKQFDKQETLLSELLDFRDKLKRAADLHLDPDFNDGVVLNIAPLWELVPWAEAKKYWNELLEGKYEWSSVSRQLREKGVS
jgi:hypothetical protein